MPVVHSIEEDLVCGWLEEWIRLGQRRLEAAFEAFLSAR